ncbi:MAG: YncE family protein [Acidobacteria bacterium]|nr:YncE family protein [Acidobacteriota bacterium]
MKTFALLVVLSVFAPLAYSQSGYHLTKKVALPGDGGWDYVSVDSVNRRLYVSHGVQVEVLDADTGAIVGNIPAPTVDPAGKPVAQNVHGAAVVPELGRGFTTNGRAATMTIFDLKTLKIIQEVPIAPGPDGFLFDPATRRVFSFSRSSKNASAVNGAEGTVARILDLGGVPEAAAADGKGNVLITIQDQDRIVKFDSKKLEITDSWPVAPACTQPTSMAIDRKNSRLFVGCRGKQFIVMNTETGKVLTTLPIGQGTDAATYDPDTRLIFISNGEGTVTIIHQETPDKYTIVETLKTEEGAKTMALDLKTHRIYVATADRSTPPAPAPGEQPAARVVAPGTFRVLMYDKN